MQPMPETADNVKENRSSLGSRVQLAFFTALFFYWLYQRVASEHTPAVQANKWLLICSAFIVFHLRGAFGWPLRTRQALKILHWTVGVFLVGYFIRAGW